MEPSSAVKLPTNAGILDPASQGYQASAAPVTDAAATPAAAPAIAVATAATPPHDGGQEEAMKNTWLNPSEPLSLAPAMSPPPGPAFFSSTTTTSSAETHGAAGSAPDQAAAAAAAAAATAIKRPLRLLDLPVDILKDIVKEVTHTNDLTSLALCHSALHRLVIPHIYSRFDIVWPDSVTPAEPRTGVDALTYGLATLVMAEDVFGEPRVTGKAVDGRPSDSRVRRRRGNYYAHFTRKFSLGNGPPEWVQEYLISKEGGKMLGTLVALAVARMRNLESFIWDMPTGILRDVWIALSSLDDRDDGQPCRLERIAVRFHDNSLEPHALPLHHPPPPGSAIPSLDYVEHPSFSVLPPLKALSVLDIDELQYLDEMSVLIGRSQTKLRELRVGIARHLERDWTQVWDSDHLQQVDKDHPTAGSLTIGMKRLGGVLGVLTAWVSDMRRTYSLPHRPKRLRRRSNATVAPHPPQQQHSDPTHAPEIVPAESQHSSPLRDGANDITVPTLLPDEGVAEQGTDDMSPGKSVPASAGLDTSTGAEPGSAASSTSSATVQSSTAPLPSGAATVAEEDDSKLCGKLSLEILELERVPLSIPVLQNVIDWSVLTSLTLLSCPNHEHLWKTLRRLYTPIGGNVRHYATSDPSKSKQKLPRAPISPLDYRLKLKKIHTDAVSPSLINFIRETLAPNSLEVVFLQEAGRSESSTVSIDSIFRGVIRKHRSSLKKVLIDSSERGAEGQPIANSISKRWMLTREMVEFVMSGRMPALRELGVTLDYRDWHYFLQHLPSIPHLRSLYIPYMANYVHGSLITEPRELALQIVDIVALRPEIELCYIGIAKKCFELLENPQGKDRDGISGLGSTMTGDDDGDDEDDDDVDVDDDMGDDEDDDDEDDDDDDDGHSQHSSSASTEPADSDSEEEASEGRRKDVQLSLREILYYDDKVTIFKARHGKL